MKRGFSLLEFLIFCALLLAATTVLLPRALRPRQEINEEQALGYLAMIGAAERAWQEETGAYVGLVRLVGSTPKPAGAPDAGLTLLLSPEFLVDDASVGHRGGFRFRLGRGLHGAIEGCWAWPNLRGFSGSATYWADFASGTVRRVLGDAKSDAPPQQIPNPDQLGAEVLIRF